MKEILLSKGKFAIVDDEDFAYLSQWKWYFSDTGYAMRNESIIKNGRRSNKIIRMHRVIMNVPKGKETDHINGDKLDNRKLNLRVCSHYENNLNKDKKLDNTTGYKGVVILVSGGKSYIMAQINVKRKHIYLGLHATKELAAMAYNEAAKEYHGEFARLNIIK